MTSAQLPLDFDRLADWFAGQGVEFTWPIDARLLTGGRSRLTYLLCDAVGRQVVLRMAPTGADTSGIVREHVLLDALGQTSVQVPAVVGLSTDDAVLSVPFSVVDFVDGQVLATVHDGAALAPEAKTAACQSLVAALAAVHAQDPAALGFDAQRGANYLTRQLNRWMSAASSAVGPGVPQLRAAGDTLIGTAPVQRQTTLVHGDYKFANVLVADNGEVAAVIDWELAAAGDPLTDLGGLLAMWPEPGESALFDSPTSASGFWTRRHIVAEYARLTGVDVADIAWYHAFALWRIACLLKGVTNRYRSGVMADDGFDVERNEQLIGQLADEASAALSVS